MKILNSATLKIFAIFAMTLDHIGYIYNIPEFRVIGRLSFPILFFLLLEGYKYTRNVKRYIKRLIIFGVVSALPFYLVFGTPFNVMFTFALTIIFLEQLKKIDEKKCDNKRKYFLILCTVIIFSIIALPFDWGFPAIITAFIASKNKSLTFRAYIIPISLFIACIVPDFLLDTVILKNYFSFKSFFMFNAPILFDIFILKLYNGKKGFSMKYFFYVYYPLHLLILYFISL